MQQAVSAPLRKISCSSAPSNLRPLPHSTHTSLLSDRRVAHDSEKWAMQALFPNIAADTLTLNLDLATYETFGQGRRRLAGGILGLLGILLLFPMVVTVAAKFARAFAATGATDPAASHIESPGNHPSARLLLAEGALCAMLGVLLLVLGTPLKFLHLYTGSYLASLLLIVGILLLIFNFGFAMEYAALHAKPLAVAAILGFATFLAVGAWLNWQLDDAWLNAPRWLRFAGLLPFLWIYSFAEEVVLGPVHHGLERAVRFAVFLRPAPGNIPRLHARLVSFRQRTGAHPPPFRVSCAIFHPATPCYRCVTVSHRLGHSRGIIWCYTRLLVHCRCFPSNLSQVTAGDMKEIAIVGGGPAGALCGERLASAGFQVTIYDERLAWEKPCGGGLTHKAIEAYPFLLDSPQPKKIVRKAELISSSGHRAQFEMNHPIVIYARKVLNGLLLDRAIAAGCTAVCSRVTNVNTNGPRVSLMAGGEQRFSDFIVLAAGARNQLLPETTALGSKDLEVTLGYFVPTEEDIIKVKFLKQFEGYLWSFPRADHLSVGICAKMGQTSTPVLRGHLDAFFEEEKIPRAGAQFYSHVLPSPQAKTIRSRKIMGRNWAMAGDAAATVDPITGEGLYYALRSGDLLAQAIAAGQPELYPEQLRAAFSADLEFAANIAKKIFRGNFLGSAITTRMVQLLNYSPAFRDLIRDVFSGSQDYRSLKRRLWNQLGITVAEFTRSFLDPRTIACARTSAPAPASDREPAQ